MKRIVGISLLVFVTIFTVTFTLLNSQMVKVNYYFGQYQIDLLVVMIICLVVGALLGLAAALGKIIAMKQELMRKDRKLRVTEKELENLRSLPLKDD